MTWFWPPVTQQSPDRHPPSTRLSATFHSPFAHRSPVFAPDHLSLLPHLPPRSRTKTSRFIILQNSACVADMSPAQKASPCSSAKLRPPRSTSWVISLSRNVASAPRNSTLLHQTLPNFPKVSPSTTGPYQQCLEFINKPTRRSVRSIAIMSLFTTNVPPTIARQVSNQPLQQLYRTSDTPQAIDRTDKAGQ